jgi:hypothetical protein
MTQITRNKVKLQAYQREYAQRKRAPGRRKVSKAERAVLEEQHMQRHQLMEMEGVLPCSKAAFGQCVCTPSCHLNPFCSYTEIKGICMCTHCTLTKGGSWTYYRYDRKGRKG